VKGRGFPNVQLLVHLAIPGRAGGLIAGQYRKVRLAVKINNGYPLTVITLRGDYAAG